MLEDILEKKINSINKNAETEINSVKYIVNLIQTNSKFFKRKFKNYSEKEVYKELKEIINEMYNTYPSGDEDGFEGERSEENIQTSIILGFEKIKGNFGKVLDGYYDSEQKLKLTEKGIKILNNYRLARNELPLKDYKKHLLKEIISLSDHLS